MDIRDRIRMVIDQNPDMSVRSVSLSAGLSDSMLGKFLKGDIDSLTLKTVDKLAAALGVDPRWLAYGEGDMEEFADLGEVLGRISKKDRGTAIRVLEAFIRTGTHG